MISPKEINNFHIKIVPCNEIPKIVDYLLKFYFTDEPLSKCLNLTKSPEAVKFLKEFCTEALKENVSVLATDKTGKIAGVSCNVILRKNIKHFNFNIDPKIEKIATFVLKTIDEAKVFEKYDDVNEALYIAFMSVHPGFRNQGLAKILLEQSRLLALSLGLKVMRMDCCSLYTAKAAQRFGWECLNEIKYVDYTIDGKQVFKPEEPHKELGIYGIRIENTSFNLKSSI
ncbi:arylalkylamine N-acetyltransferase 1-like [Onthophagus taurus]|uniref:arylalkylamine N-acetyltransferase 1-like n=1 Tax=Onthophagus taurus TaxID=166361 RepID=UPI0039BDE056